MSLFYSFPNLFHVFSFQFLQSQSWSFSLSLFVSPSFITHFHASSACPASIMEFVNLIQELNQGRNLAHQLRDHLHPSLSSSSSSPSSNGILLIDQILRSYENALSVLAGGSSGSGDEEIPPAIAAVKHRDVSKKR